MSNWSVTGPEGGVYSFSAREAARSFAREKGGLAAGYRLSEYGARIARGLSTGLSRTQARGHAPAYRGPSGGYLFGTSLKPSQQAKIKLAREVMKDWENRDNRKLNSKGKRVVKSLADVAKEHHTTADMVKRYIPYAGIRRVAVLEKGSLGYVYMDVSNLNSRRLLSRYLNKIKEFQSTNPDKSREAAKWLSREHKIKLADGRIVTLENDLERIRAISESGAGDFEFYEEVA